MSVVLFLLWLILNARITVEIGVVGLVATGAAMLFLWKFLDWPPGRELAAIRQIPQIILYAGLLVKEILLANVFVAKVIYRKKPQPVIRTFRTKLKTNFARTVLANSITITPGTVTLTCEGDLLTVHCLMPELAQSLEDSSFERRLLRIEEGFHG